MSDYIPHVFIPKSQKTNACSDAENSRNSRSESINEETGEIISLENSRNSGNSSIPSFENGWEKVFPVKGNPYWRKDGNELSINKKEFLTNPQTIEQKEYIQTLLMKFIACYLHAYPNCFSSTNINI